MRLTLALLRCPDTVTPEQRVVTGGEYSIGRGPENDWVLPDPPRLLSKRHCVVAFRSGSWQVTDLSTNGTFINHETAPIGPRGRPLRAGDRLVLGAYEIEIGLADEARDDPYAWDRGATARDPFGPNHDNDQDPFGPARNTERDRFGTPSVEDNPFAQGPGAGSRPALPDDFDPFADDFIPAPSTTHLARHNAPHREFQPPPAQSDHTPAFEDAFRPPPAIVRLPDDWALDAHEAPPAPSRPAATAPPAPPPSARATDELLAAFLRGARAEGTRIDDPVRTMESLGEVFRAMVAGLRQALIARLSIKGEFRIEQTMIRASGNNPLKFSADDDDAVASLLGVGRRGGMPPAASVAEALSDIQHHELATLAAMQEAVRALMVRLDPPTLERQSSQAGFQASLGKLLNPGKVRAWDAFVALHAEISDALSDDFDSVFGKAFARAYEQALHDIAEQDRRR